MPKRSTAVAATLAGALALGLAMVPAGANAAQVQACANVQVPTPATQAWYDFTHATNPLLTAASDWDTVVQQVRTIVAPLNASSSSDDIDKAQSRFSLAGVGLEVISFNATTGIEIPLLKLEAALSASDPNFDQTAFNSQFDASLDAVDTAGTAFSNAANAWGSPISTQLNNSPLTGPISVPDPTAGHNAAAALATASEAVTAVGANKVVLQTVSQCATVVVPDVAVQSASVTYGKATSVNATVALGGVPQSGNLVALLDGKPLATPQINGTTTLAVPANLSVGVHYVTTAYSASGAAAPSVALGTITVTKAPTSATVKLNHSSVKKGKSAKATVTVVAPGTALVPSGKVTVYVNGKKFATKSLSKGKATVSLKTSKKGTQKVTVKYATSVNFAASSSKSTSLRIK